MMRFSDERPDEEADDAVGVDDADPGGERVEAAKPPGVRISGTRARPPRAPHQEVACRSFEDVHALLARPARRYIRREVRSEAESEDIFQTAMLEIDLRIEADERVLEAPAKVLYGIIDNEVDRYVRRIKREKIDHSAEADALPDSDPDPQQLLDDAQANAFLTRKRERAFERMKPDEVKALRLSREDGLTYDEIAKQLGCKPGTVGTWIHRARAKLKELMAPHFDLQNGLRREK